jgi:hypothetical protein
MVALLRLMDHRAVEPSDVVAIVIRNVYDALVVVVMTVALTVSRFLGQAHQSFLVGLRNDGRGGGNDDIARETLRRPERRVTRR